MAAAGTRPASSTSAGNRRAIVGGTLVQDERQYEWLGTFGDGRSNGSCGASLIWFDLMLTAAHCNITVGGTVYLGSINYKHYPYSVKVVDVVTHPKFDSVHGLAYDFKILKLEEAPSYSFIEINGNPNIPVKGESLRVAGFGYQNEDGIGGFSEDLKEAKVEYIEDCEDKSKYIYGLPGFYYSKDFMICAAGVDPIRDACKGDSGGPLISGDSTLVGMVSWGFACGRRNAPGVYARVSVAYPWILRMICDLSETTSKDCGSIGQLTRTPTTSNIATEALTGRPPMLAHAPVDTEAFQPQSSEVRIAALSMNWYILWIFLLLLLGIFLQSINNKILNYSRSREKTQVAGGGEIEAISLTEAGMDLEEEHQSAYADDEDLQRP